MNYDPAPEVRQATADTVRALRSLACSVVLDRHGRIDSVNGDRVFVDAYVHTTTREVSIAVKFDAREQTRWHLRAIDAAFDLAYEGRKPRWEGDREMRLDGRIEQVPGGWVIRQHEARP